MFLRYPAGGRVGKSVDFLAIVIDMISVQLLLSSFCCVSLQDVNRLRQDSLRQTLVFCQ